MPEFIIVQHQAQRAGLHYDLRFEIPDSKNWASFAVKKGVPTEVAKKVLAVRTHDHSREEALFLGEIKEGYGKGILKEWDRGECEIIKYSSPHIVVKFNGKKIQGIYHFISLGLVNRGQYKARQYMLFKGKLS